MNEIPNERLERAVAAFTATHGRPPVVLFDQDGVLVDWDSRLEQLHGELFPEFDAPKAGSWTSFDLFGGLSIEQTAAMQATLDHVGFYSDIPAMPGAADAVGAVTRAGATTGVCTTPWPTNPTCASDKLDSVARLFGAQLARATTITHDKTAVVADILIDDKPTITGRVAEPAWVRIFFTQRYNRGLPGWRIDTWDEGADVIADVLFELARGA
ncbi:MAG TPA: hypothetical protein VL043_06585 [Protaetiibacter sp.]|nr:hypothetical protein [Protaetiibacter sp.]